jgi:phage/plasmid primase-like uncharacterized protein
MTLVIGIDIGACGAIAALQARSARRLNRGIAPMTGAAHDAWVDKARAVRIESELARRAITLKGKPPELAGPCPVCGGTDRFSVHTGKQAFNCRGCGGKGRDAISLVRFLDGIDFLDAVEKLTGEPRPNGKTASDPKRLSSSALTITTRPPPFCTKLSESSSRIRTGRSF